MIRALSGPAAVDILKDEAFHSSWRKLVELCPWSTCFQDPGFVALWFESYGHLFEPLLVLDEQSTGLSGLLTLAIERTTGRLVYAGANHSEYQTWLAPQNEGDVFIEAAVRWLSDQFSGARLRLLFLAPGSPTGWLARSGLALIHPIARPLMRTRPADMIRASLRKKSNKSKLNRLERAGTLVFETIEDPDSFSAAMDEIVAMCDFRQGAINHSLPFQSDPPKKRFLEGLMRIPKFLHVTVMRLNGRLIAAHVGSCNRRQVVLGTVAHSPFFASYSPGKFHMLFLGLKLEADGFEFLDLTPGEVYKERFATEEDQAHIVNISFNATRAFTYRWKRRTIDVGKRFIEVNTAKRALERVRHKTALLRATELPGEIGRRAQGWIWGLRELRIYRIRTASVPERVLNTEPLKRDCIEDLLLFRPTETWQPSLYEFLECAMRRIEAGEHVYTYAINGDLVHYGWLTERREYRDFRNFGQEFAFSPNSAVLYDYHTHPRYRDSKFCEHSLLQMSRDAFRVPGTDFVYIAVMSDNVQSRRVIEKIGFEYQTSCYEKKRCGRVVRWVAKDDRRTIEVDGPADFRQNSGAY